MRIGDESRFEGYALNYFNLFKTTRSNQFPKAAKYFRGLFQSSKRNMERMCEVVKDSEYYATQHFISESPWDYQAVMDLTSRNVAKALGSTGSKIGLLIDEVVMQRRVSSLWEFPDNTQELLVRWTIVK